MLGRVGLLGDSAHAMLPFFGQGAGEPLRQSAWIYGYEA